MKEADGMKRVRFTDEQIIGTLKEQESGQRGSVNLTAIGDGS